MTRTTPRRYAALDLLLERGLLPDPVLRIGTAKRLRREERDGVEAQDRRLGDIVARMSTGDVAERPEKASDVRRLRPTSPTAPPCGRWSRRRPTASVGWTCS